MSNLNEAPVLASEESVSADNETFHLTRTHGFLNFDFESPSTATREYGGCPEPELGDRFNTRGCKFRIATRGTDI